MSLKNLTFATAPIKARANPIFRKRQTLTSRLEEQIQLAKNSDYAPVVKRWKRGENGKRSLVETQKKVSPCSVEDIHGDIYLIVRSGLLKIEFETGKPAIKVGKISSFENVLKTLIDATEKGELDKLFPVSK